MIAGGGGALLAGWVNDRIARRSGPAGKLRLLMAICLVALPSTLLVLAPTFGAGLAPVILSLAVMPMVGATMVSTIRSTAGPVGQECVSPGRSCSSPYPSKPQHIQSTQQ